LPRRLQVSIERNELLAQQLACSRAEAKLNIQGKKVALVAQASDLLRKERKALREYRSQVNYDSADSECREMKNNIVFYKIKTEEAKGALEEPKLRSVEPGAVEPGAPLSSVSFLLRSGPGSVDEDSP
jgi:16S rRNA U516 pseudouridylate synthase RsuA-like enzyme